MALAVEFQASTYSRRNVNSSRLSVTRIPETTIAVLEYFA
jgi:hypothetical protein